MRLVVVGVVLLECLSLGSVEASNNFGANCASCHASALSNGGLRPGAMDVLADALLNLDASRNDSIDRGAIPFFTASPGESIALPMQVVNGWRNYAVSIDNFEAGSVTGPVDTNFLAGYVPDSSWFNYASAPPNFFINVSPSFGSISWPAGQSTPVAYTFNLTLSPTTPPATYELEFTLAGSQFGTPSLFIDSQYFYLQVVDDPQGDFDDDGDVDGADFLTWQRNQSVGALSGWTDNFGAIVPLLATGISPLATTLPAPETSVAVPEPTSAILLVGLCILPLVYRLR